MSDHIKEVMMVLRCVLTASITEMLREVVHELSFLVSPSLRLVVIDTACNGAVVCKTVFACVHTH